MQGSVAERTVPAAFSWRAGADWQLRRMQVPDDWRRGHRR